MIALCLLPLLSACETAPVKTKSDPQPIPAALLSPCPKSELRDNTYQGAIELAEARGKEIDECNKRLEDIRAWSAP